MPRIEGYDQNMAVKPKYPLDPPSSDVQTKIQPITRKQFGAILKKAISGEIVSKPKA